MAFDITTDAVMFFDDGEVVKEMLYPEFEAILDHVVAIAEFENMEIPAAYVRINSSLKIVAVVLFLIQFDNRGYVDKSWNIPLAHLAENSGKGPDLGAGPIRLSCRSQCSISWHQRSMWDPDLHSGNKTLMKLAGAAKRNRLGLTIVEEPEVVAPIKEEYVSIDLINNEPVDKNSKAKLTKKFQKELKAKVAALQEEHKLRVSTMKAEAQDHIQKLQNLYRDELKKVNEVIATTKHLFAEEKQKNIQLKNTLDQQSEAFKSDKEQFKAQVERSQEISQEQLLKLEEKYELEANAKIEQVKTELKEMLDMREVELYYRDEQIGRLNAELSELRQEKQKLLDSSGDQLLQRLADSGVSFIAYQPGVEHLTIPVKEISRYLESPVDYVSEKCAVEPELYKQWRTHFQLPVCNHKMDDGSLCGEPIPKVEKPARFIVGESDRCARHNRASNTLADMMKTREIS